MVNTVEVLQVAPGIRLDCVRFMIFTAVKFQILVLWVLSPYSIGDRYEWFRGTCSLYHKRSCEDAGRK